MLFSNSLDCYLVAETKNRTTRMQDGIMIAYFIGLYDYLHLWGAN